MKNVWLAAGVLTATVSAGVGAASAVGENTVKACYDAGGSLKVQLGAACPKGWTPTQWSVTGPQGPVGETGATGPAGPAGAQGPAGLSAIVHVREGLTADPTGEALALCPEGTSPINGGVTDPQLLRPDSYAVHSEPFDHTNDGGRSGWRGVVGFFDPNRAGSFVVYAICVSVAPNSDPPSS
jgi:hypothetical protein